MSAKWWRDLVDLMAPSVGELKQLRETVNLMGREKVAKEREIADLKCQLIHAGVRVARIRPTGMAESVSVADDIHRALGMPPVEPVGASPEPKRVRAPRKFNASAKSIRLGWTATDAMHRDGTPAPTTPQVQVAATGEGKP